MRLKLPTFKWRKKGREEPQPDHSMELANSMLSRVRPTSTEARNIVTGSNIYSCPVEAARDQACMTMLSCGEKGLSDNALQLVKRELDVELAEKLFGEKDFLAKTDYLVKTANIEVKNDENTTTARTVP